MFCIKCGAQAVAGNFCEKHFLERSTLFELDDFTTYFCRQCGTFRHGPVEEQIRSSIKTKNTVTKCEIKTKRVGNRLVVSAACSGYIRPLKSLVTEEKKSFVIIKNKTCENCVKISGNYHESVLQVRGPNQEKVMKKLRYLLPHNSIVAINRLKEGYNILITDKKIAAKTVGVLQEKFSITSSYKLVGQKKGKKLYRNYYAVR
jgi:NMD protein affecting ribosome stability and mRNA decay